MSETAAIPRLHQSLVERDTPEAIAEIVRQALPRLAPRKLRSRLDKVIAGSMKRRFGWSSLARSFHRPMPMTRQLAKARELAQLFLGAALPAAEDPAAIQRLIEELNRLIGKTPGKGSFANDRLDRAGRAKAGLGLSRRRYDKLFRLADRLELRRVRLMSEEAKLRLVLVSKAALAPDLTVADLGDHLPTAAFVAYYAARMKLRSEFTIAGQQRPFDEVSQALLGWCESEAGTRWHAVAHVFPRTDVLARLDDGARGRLLGRSFDILQELADRLDQAQSRSAIDLDSMVVKRGNDSSTWNVLGGAWNRARDHWLALIDAMGMQALFEVMLPGKVMRLMAADVAAWHRLSGGSLHPDTAVWRELPKPWLVLRGEAECTRTTVEAACARASIDPVKSGWTAPRARTEIAAFRPTPELVHGVAVANPYYADLLRRLGAFSGKALTPHRIADVLGD